MKLAKKCISMLIILTITMSAGGCRQSGNSSQAFTKSDEVTADSGNESANGKSNELSGADSADEAEAAEAFDTASSDADTKAEDGQTDNTTEDSAGSSIDGAADASSSSPSGSTEGTVLPPYSYPGTDSLYQAICDYIVATFGGTGTVCIPCPLVIDMDESNPDDIRVLGEFWYHQYELQGEVLQTVSAGSVPGMMHLQRKDTEYEVTGIDIAEDDNVQEYGDAENIRDAAESIISSKSAGEVTANQDHSESAASPDNPESAASPDHSEIDAGSVEYTTGNAEEIFGENYQAYLALNSFISVHEIFRTQMLEDYLVLNHIPAIKIQDSAYQSADLIPKTASLSSVEELALRDNDGSGESYSFSYGGETFTAAYSEDNWKIIDSWKIRNAGDMEMICGALQAIHPVHSRDGNGTRTAEDMMFEWMQHNFAYEHLPEEHPWREHAKDVDLNPADQGKTFFEIYENRTGDRFRIGDFLGDMSVYLEMLQEVDID